MHWLNRWFPKLASTPKPKIHVWSFRPGLEILEDRRVLTPVAPTLYAPSGWSPPLPTFSWSADADASYYNFQIFNTNTKALITGPGLMQTTLALGAPLILGDTYQWSVQAVDGSGNLGPWSTLTIGVTNLTAPALIGPSGPASSQPIFSWAALAGANHYDIWVQNQSTSQVLRNTDVTETTWTPQAPLAQGYAFTWWVRGIDSNGISGPWSRPLTFSEAVLPAPTLIGPGGTAVLQPTFSWGPVSGADHYDIWLQNQNTGQIIRDTNVSGTTWAPSSALIQQDNYTWWVRAIDPNGFDGQWSTPQTFAVYALAAPSLVSPTGTSATLPTFSWNAVTGADHYDIWVQDTRTGQVLRDQSVTGTTWAPSSPLTPGDSYKWWVRALDSANNPSPWSSSQAFTVYVLAAPSLVSPTGTSATLPTFSWNAVVGADHYDIWVQDIQTGQVLRNQSVTGTTWSPTSPLIQGHGYSWWVRAVDNTGHGGAWSSSLNFSVAALATPTLIGPTGTSTTLPSFNWNAVAGADHYDIWVQNMRTGQVLRDQSVTGTTWVPASPLAPGDSYKWWVRAIDSVNSPGPWSSSQTFTVAVVSA
jgi:hypothetical protein